MSTFQLLYQVYSIVAENSLKTLVNSVARLNLNRNYRKVYLWHRYKSVLIIDKFCLEALPPYTFQHSKFANEINKQFDTLGDYNLLEFLLT